MARITALLFLMLLAASPASAFADDAPAWLKQAAALPVPVFDKKIGAVVLVDNSTLTVADDGLITEVSTYAVRILNREDLLLF